MVKYSAACLLLFLLFRCSEKKASDEERFLEYMFSTFDIEPVEGVYVIIPEGSCSGCKDMVIDYLGQASIDVKTTIVHVGEPNEAKTLYALNKVRERGVEVLIDIELATHKFDIVYQQFPIVYISLIKFEGHKWVKEDFSPSQLSSSKKIKNAFKL